MSDTPNDQPDPNDPEPEGDIRDFRAAKDEASSARKEAEQARRELAFAKAGIDTDSGVGKLLFQSYQGDPSKDAVLAAAAEYGINPTTDAKPQPEIPADEREQQRLRADLATGSDVPSAPDEGDPGDVGLRRFQEARARGASPQDASVAYFDTKLAAAYSGDERAIYTPEKWARKVAGDA